MAEPASMASSRASAATSVLRAMRLVLHLGYALFLAVFYPWMNERVQVRIMKRWSRQLLAIFNIGIQIEGQQPLRSERGCMLVANHISWLDIFVLNAICPARFIAKGEVRRWPVIGWLCKRSGTIFIERAMRRDAARVNRIVGSLLKQGTCVGLFPEGTTTDGTRVEHFHSSLLQPVIDTHAALRPVALRYFDADGFASTAAAFTDDTTLLASIWRILRYRQLNAMVGFTAVIPATLGNRRVMAQAAREAVAQALQHTGMPRHAIKSPSIPDARPALLASQSAYALLVSAAIEPVRK